MVSLQPASSSIPVTKKENHVERSYAQVHTADLVLCRVSFAERTPLRVLASCYEAQAREKITIRTVTSYLTQRGTPPGGKVVILGRGKRSRPKPKARKMSRPVGMGRGPKSGMKRAKTPKGRRPRRTPRPYVTSRGSYAEVARKLVRKDAAVIFVEPGKGARRRLLQVLAMADEGRGQARSRGAAGNHHKLPQPAPKIERIVVAGRVRIPRAYAGLRSLITVIPEERLARAYARAAGISRDIGHAPPRRAAYEIWQPLAGLNTGMPLGGKLPRRMERPVIETVRQPARAPLAQKREPSRPALAVRNDRELQSPKREAGQRLSAFEDFGRQSFGSGSRAIISAVRIEAQAGRSAVPASPGTPAAAREPERAAIDHNPRRIVKKMAVPGAVKAANRRPERRLAEPERRASAV